MCSLIWRNVTWKSKFMQYLLVQSFYSILSICIYLWACKAQSRVCLFLSRPICSLPGLPASVQTPALCWAFPPGESAPWPSAAPVIPVGRSKKKKFLLAFCAPEGTRGQCQIHPISELRPLNTHSFQVPRWPPQVGTPGYPLAGSSHLLILEGGSSNEQWHALL